MTVEHTSMSTSVSNNNSVSVIGAGLIGRGWAIVFARAGWHVKLYDLRASVLDVARREIANQLTMLVGHGLCSEPDSIMQNIHFEADLAEALTDVDYVQECGPEILEEKQALFSKLDQLSAPDVILASSTSGFMTSEFAAHLSGRHRTLVVHPVNPPHLVPLVEISPAPWTNPHVVQTTHQIMQAVNQTPITVQKEVPGFILNRLQGAVLNEALRLVNEGYATSDDVDKAVRDGLGLRWSFIGPFETIDLNAPAGLADYAQRYGPMYGAMADSQSTRPDWSEEAIAIIHDMRRELLDIEDLNRRQDWRDDRLASLVAHKSKQKN